jgi:translocation and assembly module TamB
MWVVRRDDVSARVSGEARALKTAQSAEVRGDLEVLDAIIDVGRIAPSNRVQVVEVDETVPPRDDEGAGREAGPPIGLDVAVNAPEGILLRGPGLKSAWGGQLDVEGTVAEPRISGEFRADTGEVRLLGREFDFGESFVSLDPQHPADPYLNVQLVTRAKDARAEVRLNGIVSDLEIDLTSDPPLPREEVLARVLFGRPLDRVTPLQMAQLARYGAVFSGQTSLNRLLGGGQVLGLDALDLRMGPGMEKPVLGIGKQLGDVYLELEQGLDPESTKAQVEIELSPTWRVTGESRPDASGSAGIFWEERY